MSDLNHRKLPQVTTEKPPSNHEVHLLSPYDRLSEADTSWLGQFDIVYTPDVAQTFNDILEADVDDMRLDYDPELRQAIILNRQAFFDLLSLPAQKVSVRHPTLYPTRSVLAALRTYAHYGLDVPKVTSILTPSMSYGPSAIRAKITVIQDSDIGIDLVNRVPTLLSLSSDTLRLNIDGLIKLGLNVKKVTSIYPNILNFNHETLQERMEFMRSFGLDSVKIVNSQPTIIGLSPANIHEKFNFFSDKRMPAHKIFSTCPSVLSMSSTAINEKIEYIKSLGINVQEISEKFPAILTCSSDALSEKVDTLTSLGLDAVVVTRKLPMILGMSRSKIILTVYTLMKYDLWEGSCGYREQMNNGKNVSIFAVPIESLLIYVQSNSFTPTKNIGSAAKTYTKTIVTAKNKSRKELAQDMLKDSQSRKALGFLAVIYVLKEGLEITDFFDDIGTNS